MYEKWFGVGGFMELQKLENITKDVLREFNGITYSINTSKKSDSLYLYLYLQGTQISMRIANHQYKNKYHFKEIIKDKINPNNLKRAIHNLCVSLQRKRTYFLLSCLDYRRQLATMR